MTTRKLFVSHSSKTRDNVERLKKICHEIDKPDTGYRSLWDQSGAITAGSDWDRRLNEWMAECHATVILFSEAVHDSLWVQKEAAILSWRRELEQDFMLIPVLLNGQTPNELEEGLFGILRINKDQCIKDCTEPAEIVKKVLEGLRSRQRPFPRTPFERLTSVLADILEKEAKGETLEDAWNTLAGNDKPIWRAGQGTSFSETLARYLIRDGIHAMEYLKQVLNRIRPRVSRESDEELLCYLASLWVNPEAAGGISAVRAGGNVAAINGGYVEVYTAERYAERAWPLDDTWRLISIDTTKYSFDAVSQLILDDFRPNTIRVPDSAVDRLVNGSQDPIVVLLPQTGESPQPPDSQLIQRLRDKFPKIIWLVHTGPDVPDYLLDSYPQLTIRILEPLVDLQTEIAQLLLFEKTRNFIDEQLHRSL